MLRIRLFVQKKTKWQKWDNKLQLNANSTHMLYNSYVTKFPLLATQLLPKCKKLWASMTSLKLYKIKSNQQIVRNLIASVLKNSNANFRRKIILFSNCVQELRATSQKQTITLKRGMNGLRKSNNWRMSLLEKRLVTMFRSYRRDLKKFKTRGNIKMRLLKP